MAAFEEVKALAGKTYVWYWYDWYQNIPNVTPARYDFQISDLSAGYNHSENLLLDPICEENLNDCDILDEDGWPIWKIQLVHEMLHEYQYKAVTQPSDQGIELYTRFKNTFSGQGHDEKFFTAIAEKASYFCITAEELVMRI